jgi:hypothetical protein
MFSRRRTSHTSFRASLLCAGFMTLAFAPACAARGYYSTYQRDYYRDVERQAYENGYAKGLRQGQRDARGWRPYSYERHDVYRDADDGYHRDYGDRDFYKRFFRQGFQAGYSAGFSRVAADRAYEHPYAPSPPPAAYTYPAPPPVSAPYVRTTPYPGNVAPAYSSPAAQTGYRDGFEAGRNDARDRDSYDPVRSRRYRSGDHGYDDRFGLRDAYKQQYRMAFQQGYDQGYRQYWR